MKTKPLTYPMPIGLLTFSLALTFLGWSSGSFTNLVAGNALFIILVIVLFVLIHKYKEKKQIDANWKEIKQACLRFKLKPEVIYEVKKRFYNEEEFGSIFKWEGIKQKCLVAQLKPKKIREFKKLFDDNTNSVPFCITEEQLKEYINKTIEREYMLRHNSERLEKVGALDKEIEKHLGIKLGSKRIYINGNEEIK